MHGMLRAVLNSILGETLTCDISLTSTTLYTTKLPNQITDPYRSVKAKTYNTCIAPQAAAAAELFMS